MASRSSGLVIDDALWATIAKHLPAYCETQRWYAEKGRPIDSVELVDAAVVDRNALTVFFAIVRFIYDEQTVRHYFIPMTVHRVSTPERSTIAMHMGRFWIQDAPSDEVFRDFLVEAGRGLELTGSRGTFAFDEWQIDGARVELDPSTRSTANPLEQSNSSIMYGMQVIAKLYRRIEPGQNIEVDMNRYLASDAHLAAVPKLIGCITYRGEIGNMPLALIQQHAGEHRDCWSALTAALEQRDDRTLDLVERLGTVTAEMHVALAAAPVSSPLAPELITTEDIADWKRSFLQSAYETDRLTRERSPILQERSASAARRYLARASAWDERALGFDSLAGLYKTRVHGDYHLGQILLTEDGRLLIVDFEGEPQRSAAERAAKYSPLRDVAGMLRSLAYARGLAESASVQANNAHQSQWFADWFRTARHRFMAAYRATIADAIVPVVPSDDAALQRALTALESDKALYEVRYELNSRPDWAWLPLEIFE